MAPSLARPLVGLACLVAGASAAALSPLQARDSSLEPKYTPLDGTASNCVWWWNTNDGLSCSLMLTIVGISEEDFISWNPSITSGCGNYATDRSYCIKIDESGPITSTPTTPTTTTTVPPTTTTPPTNGITTPTPTQPGMVDNCDAFHLVEPKQGCATIASLYGISLDEFLTWNPQVGGTTCSGLWANVYVCVSIIGHTPTPTDPGNGITTPTPTQTGMVDNCDTFHLVKSGDGCQSIADAAGIPLDIFYTWNPAVGENCESLWLDNYVCIGTTTYTPPPTSTDPGNGISTPTPTQTGMTPNCKKFHFVELGETCVDIIAEYGISLSNFVSWNPAAGSDCTGLWANTYACVGT